MDVRIEILPDRSVLFHRRIGTYDEMAPQAWMELWAALAQKDLLDKVQGAYGIALDSTANTPVDQCRYDACVALDGKLEADPRRGLGVRTLSGGSYGIYRHKGPYRLIGARFRHLFEHWLPEVSEIYDPNRPTIEIYLNHPSQVPETELLTELCIPLR